MEIETEFITELKNLFYKILNLVVIQHNNKNYELYNIKHIWKIYSEHSNLTNATMNMLIKNTTYCKQLWTVINNQYIFILNNINSIINTQEIIEQFSNHLIEISTIYTSIIKQFSINLIEISALFQPQLTFSYSPPQPINIEWYTNLYKLYNLYNKDISSYSPFNVISFFKDNWHILSPEDAIELHYTFNCILGGLSDSYIIHSLTDWEHKNIDIIPNHNLLI